MRHMCLCLSFWLYDPIHLSVSFLSARLTEGA